MKERTKRDLEELVFRSSQVPGLSKTYSVGPFGYRAGFLFQQQRALNLAQSIIRRYGDEWLQHKKIAILGGGVAGCTLMAAFWKNQIRAELFEMGDDVLSLQNSADHRLVHPNYNRWPMLDGMRNFTNLPLMNWYAAPAPRVLEQLKAEFTGYEIDPNLIHTHWECIGITENDDKAELTFKDHGKREFDLCFSTIGFGPERFTERGLSGYWTNDTPEVNGVVCTRPATIYGTGDGALIDLVRCWCRDQDSFWRIPLELISFLRDNRYVSISNQDRSDFQFQEMPDKLSPQEKRIIEHESSISALVWMMKSSGMDPNYLSSREQAFYLSFAEENIPTGGKVAKFLEELLFDPDKDAKHIPTLKGLGETPFEPTSAPINKILVAYLINTGRVDYQQLPTREQAGEEISAWLELPFEEARQNCVLVRFGSDVPIRRIAKTSDADPKFCFGDGEVSILSVLSGVAIDSYTEVDVFSDSEDLDQVAGDRKHLQFQVARRNSHLVDSFARERLACDGAKFLEEGLEKDWAFAIQYSSEEKKPSPELLRSLGGIERRVFNYPVVLSATVSTGSATDAARGFRE